LQGVGVDDEEVARFLEQAAIPVQLRLDLSERERREASAALQSGAARQGQALTLTPDQLKWRVDRLRAHLRSLGGVNPGVIAEYEEVLQRYTFLTTQSDDLQNAAASLRKVIAELDEIMRRRFEETFAAISREFRNYFTTLFNGGTARLILTDPEDVTQTGVDIIAQPPGKRLQSLSLLSGGERALTAAALLFAILSVNPTPFCVLDEVDAALDEANIGRFTDVLKHLSQQTQFIIITHNRVTMEMAENLYGVSLGPDGTSQVLSLHLDGHKPGNGLYVPSPMPEGLP
jgi:chromosome segregation protein